MKTWKSRLVFCLRHGVPVVVLAILAWLLYVILGPQPRWSLTGKMKWVDFTRDSQWVILHEGNQFTSALPERPLLQIVSTETGNVAFAVPKTRWATCMGSTVTSSDHRYYVQTDSETFQLFEFDSQRQIEFTIPKHVDEYFQWIRGLKSLSVIDHHAVNHAPRAWEGRVTVVEPATGKVLLDSSEPRRFFKATPDEQLIFNCEGPKEEGLIEIWQFRPEPQVRRFPTLIAKDLSKDGRTLLVIDRWEEYSALDIASGELRPYSQIIDGKSTPVVKQDRNPFGYVRSPVDSAFRWPAFPRFWDSAAWDKANATWKKAKAIRDKRPKADLAISACSGWALTREPLDNGKENVELWNTTSGESLFSEEDSNYYPTHHFTQRYLVLRSFNTRDPNQRATDAKLIDFSSGAVAYQGKAFFSLPKHVAIDSQLPTYIRDALKKLGIPVPTNWRIIEPDSGRTLLEFSTPHPLTNVVLSNDERTILTIEDAAESGQILKVWDIPARRPWAWILGPSLVLAGLLTAFRWRRRRLAKRKTAPVPA